MSNQGNYAAAQQSGIRSMESNHKQLVVLRCKLVIVGEAAVGKTALTQVFTSGGPTFPKNYLMTVGAEFCVKQVPIPETNVVVELSIFDCAGQSMFNQLEMNARYYEGASAVMVVYDIGSNDSLKSTPKWLEAVRNAQRSTNQRAPISVLVGNKRDFRMGAGAPGSDARAEVVLQDAQRHAASMGVQLFEVSAMTNEGVDEPFKFVAEEFYKRSEGKEAEDD